MTTIMDMSGSPRQKPLNAALLRAPGAQPLFDQMPCLGSAHKLFDTSGDLADEDSRKRVGGRVRAFAAHVGNQRKETR